MMAYAWRWIRSLFFVAQMYFMMGFLAIFFTPWALVHKSGAHSGIKTYCRWVRWSARYLVGLRSEVRGDVPDGEVLIASKHQSFFDIIMICSEVPRPKFIMKRELVRAPILGWYALRIGCVPVDRGKGGQAVAQMVSDVASGRSEPGQLIIYPQGTRVAPGKYLPYKIGTGVLYAESGQTCIPAATNVGVFWPRRGIYRKPGTAVVEFLAPISAGLETGDFMKALEHSVETQSKRLMEDAGFIDASAPPDP